MYTRTQNFYSIYGHREFLSPDIQVEFQAKSSLMLFKAAFSACKTDCFPEPQNAVAEIDSETAATTSFGEIRGEENRVTKRKPFGKKGLGLMAMSLTMKSRISTVGLMNGERKEQSATICTITSVKKEGERYWRKTTTMKGRRRRLTWLGL